MAFWVYDIIFLILFSLAVGIFLYKNRNKLEREMGIAFLYKTQVGVKILDKIANRYKRFWIFLKYIIISVGYVLMLGIIFLLGKSVYDYIKYPIISEIIKSPPIILLIPYFPTIFGLKSFFPPFYFTYFILAIAIVILVHEGAHGIYMRVNKVRIKSTGVAFFGPILGAFVEQDDKQMVKIKKRDQMSILAAGVFANIVTAIIFLFIWWGLFTITFIPSGALFDSYMVGSVKVNSINTIGGIQVNGATNQDILNLIDGNFEINKEDLKDPYVLLTDLTEIEADNKRYFIHLGILKRQLDKNGSFVVLYEDYPAVNARLKGTIIGVDGNEIRNYDDLTEVMKNYNPGDQIKIKTKFKEEVLEQDLTLGERPDEPNKPFIGVAHTKPLNTRLDKLFFFKDPFAEYKIRSDFLLFIYYLAFWIFLINLAVGFFNMLPFTVLDGGRFFYLTILGITKNEKITNKVYKGVGWIILLSLVLMMAVWFIRSAFINKLFAFF